ncbi:MAG: hypothetical protein DRJ42_15685 [Deltaproteobacteria bacterium]|nr:MAG: hypothetical protein DRJ42_15685 [Deltaproteobacteria bacterium]
MAHYRALICIALAAVFVLVAATDADAQRRRRRRRRPPPQETQQAEPPPDQEAGDGAPAEGDSDAQAEGGAQVGPAEVGDEAGGPAAAPSPGAAAPEEPAADPFLDAEGPDLGPIREEFTAIMDELVQVRSRVAVLGRQLFRTRMTVSVQNRAGDDNNLASMVLKLDGAPIFQGEGGEVSEDGAQVFDGFAAPGPHVLTIEVEQRARANDEYRYELRDTYRFQVIRDRLIEVTIVLDDDSDIAEDFEDDEEGEFDVRTRMRVATRALASQ